MPIVQADRLTKIGSALLRGRRRIAGGGGRGRRRLRQRQPRRPRLARHHRRPRPTSTASKSATSCPARRWTIVQELPATTVIDGHWGFGFHVNAKAMQLTIDKAKKTNVAACTVFRQSHVGRLAAYPLMAIKEGMIGLATADSGRSPKAVAPFGGREARLGTNPISIAVPSDLDAPFYLDMATSAVAAGKVMLAAARGEQIPDRLDRRQRRQADHRPDAPAQGRRPAAARRHRGLQGQRPRGHGGGPVRPAHRAWASASSRPAGTTTAASWRCSRSRPSGRSQQFKKEVGEFARYLKATPPSEGSSGVLYPGEIEHIREQSSGARPASTSRMPRGTSCARSPPSTASPPSSD